MRAVVGAVAAVLPILGVAIAVVLMRTEPKPEIRPRLILGSLLVGLPAVGLWHIASGSPATSNGWPEGAGVVGYVVAGPLTNGVTQWLSVPLLLMAMFFGVLLLTGTTVREVPGRLRSWFGTSYDDDYAYDHADDPDFDDDHDGDRGSDDYDPACSTRTATRSTAPSLLGRRGAHRAAAAARRRRTIRPTRSTPTRPPRCSACGTRAIPTTPGPAGTRTRAGTRSGARSARPAQGTCARRADASAETCTAGRRRRVRPRPGGRGRLRAAAAVVAGRG
ncbi:hypothetical protein P9209_21615 [Prescottella defluvii]|nr:hypothetical protein P9209_21615 [Prescottella defluvii]